MSSLYYCRFGLNLEYTTYSPCSGPRPTVVLSSRYKVDGKDSENFVDWSPMLVYTAG